MSTNTLRTPICSVLGHVDVGKTLFLDKLRNTRVQNNESGGITQQIGATYFSIETLNKLSQTNKKLDIPGLLFIDTPGHDCFSSLRIRGVEICDIAIVLVDIIKGVEKQTMHCIELLKQHKIPFIIVLNKLDRLVNWKKTTNNISSLKKSFKNQNKTTLKYIEEYANKIICQVAVLEINAALYYKNKDHKSYVSMIPVSSLTGEGISDLLMLIATLTNKFMKKKLVFHQDKARGYVMEITKNNQLGNVINVILTDGILNKNDRIIFCGNNGCLETDVKNIFLPTEKEELRDKAKFTSVNKVVASKGLMLKVTNGDKIMVGTEFFRLGSGETKEDYNEQIQSQISKKNLILEQKKYDSIGVYIHSPSSGVLEALWNLMKDKEYKIAKMNVGPLTKQTIINAGIINGNISKKYPKSDKLYYSRYAVILVYDCNATGEDNDFYGIDSKLIQFAKESNVKIIMHNTVYRLINLYEKYIIKLSKQLQDMYPLVIPKCEMNIIPKYVFCKTNPFLFGVKICKNTLCVGMLIEASLDNSSIVLGKVIGIEKNNKPVLTVNINDEVCIKIEKISIDQKYEYGIDFTSDYTLHTYYEEHDLIMLKRYHEILKIE